MPRPPSAATLLDRHLHRVAHDLRPDPAQVTQAQERTEKLIEELHEGPAWMFQVVRCDPHGSHARGTALAGSSDYDALVVLNRRALRTVRDEERSPDNTIRLMVRAINARRARRKRIVLSGGSSDGLPMQVQDPDARVAGALARLFVGRDG